MLCYGKWSSRPELKKEDGFVDWEKNLLGPFYNSPSLSFPVTKRELYIFFFSKEMRPEGGFFFGVGSMI